MGATTYFTNNAFDHIFGKITFTPPTLHLAVGYTGYYGGFALVATSQSDWTLHASDLSGYVSNNTILYGAQNAGPYTPTLTEWWMYVLPAYAPAFGNVLSESTPLPVGKYPSFAAEILKLTYTLDADWGATEHVTLAAINHFFGFSPYTFTPLYVALLSDAEAKTEMSYAGYARVQVAPSGWTRASGYMKNNSAIDFPAMTASGWERAEAWELYDAATGGNVLFRGTLLFPIVVATCQFLRIPANWLQCTWAFA